MMVANSFFVNGVFSLKAYQALLASGKQQWVLMGHSLLLSSGVAFFATLVGVPLGIVLGKTDLPFRRGLTVLLTVPLLIPPYVIAVAWFAVIGVGGWINRSLPRRCPSTYHGRFLVCTDALRSYSPHSCRS